MMKTEELIKITQKKVESCGEEVYNIEKNMQTEVNSLRHAISLHKESLVMSLLEKHLDFILKHEDFAIIFRPIKRKGLIEWLPCVAYLYHSNWTRVTLQNAKCLKCNWKGTAANPTDTDLYFTMDNDLEFLRKAFKLPFLKCPLCGNELSTKAIWVEGIEEENT